MSNVRVTRPYRKRRQYTPEFKAQLVAESQSPSASDARIALDNDLNANLLRRWINESKQSDQQLSPAFVPIKLPAAATSAVKRAAVYALKFSEPENSSTSASPDFENTCDAYFPVPQTNC